MFCSFLYVSIFFPTFYIFLTLYNHMKGYFLKKKRDKIMILE